MFFRRKAQREGMEKTRQQMLTGYIGAGNEARTRYLHLGKVALYRMSYARMWRRHPDLNRGVGDLQSPALPLGYGAEKKLVPGVGIEPTTRGFSVRCSTN